MVETGLYGITRLIDLHGYTSSSVYTPCKCCKRPCRRTVYKRETPSTMTQQKINKEMKGQLIIETQCTGWYLSFVKICSRSAFMDLRRRVLLAKSLDTSAKHCSEYSLKCVRTALLSCNRPILHKKGEINIDNFE